MVIALKRAGFEERRQTGSHIILRNPENNRMAVVPNHHGTFNVGLVHSILKQSGLTAEELTHLLEL
jgi:predicted RNA binding protein YcfA (HicA-like mRNA interferase family)